MVKNLSNVKFDRKFYNSFDYYHDTGWISMNIKFSIALFITKKNHLKLINIVKYFSVDHYLSSKAHFQRCFIIFMISIKKQNREEWNFYFIRMKRFVTFFIYCRHVHLLMKLYWVYHFSFGTCCLEWWKIMKNDQRKNFSKLSIWNG